jgi:hypothetical protein
VVGNLNSDNNRNQLEGGIDYLSSEGEHQVIWNAPKQVSGIYFIEVISENFEQIVKTVLIK